MPPSTTLRLAFRYPSAMAARIGALPFTAVGYKLSESEPIDGIGQVTRQYQGKGGLNKLYLNQSFECFNGFHLGLQAVYYFGNLEYFRDIRYDDASFFSSRYETDYLVSDMNWKLGLQYVAIWTMEIKNSSLA